MNTRKFGKLAAIGAAGALSLSLLAGVTNAALPTATPGAGVFGDFGGDGWAGFSATFSYGDGSTLAKLYFESDITGGASVPVVTATKNGSPVNGCSVQSSPLSVKCQWKTVRYGDVFVINYAVQPAASADSVSTEAKWSTTGYVTGSNNSHGDYWSAGAVVSNRIPGGQDTAAGWGNTSLSTFQTVDKTTNPQAVRLTNLPAGIYSKVNDNAGTNAFTCVTNASLGIDCTKLTGSWIDVQVADGATLGSPFQIEVKYPTGTSSPKGYVHVFGSSEEFVGPCAKSNPTYPCFTWTKNTNTATIFTYHNGGVRRS